MIDRKGRRETALKAQKGEGALWSFVCRARVWVSVTPLSLKYMGQSSGPPHTDITLKDLSVLNTA